MDKPTIISLLFSCLFGFAAQATETPPSLPLDAVFSHDHFIGPKPDAQQPTIQSDNKYPFDPEGTYPPPVRVTVEQTTVAENIFDWLHYLKKLFVYDLKHPGKNNIGQRHMKHLYKLSDQQLAILRTYSYKAMNEIDNLRQQDAEHKCKKFATDFKNSRKLATENFHQNLRKSPIRDKYLHHTFQQIIKQIPHLDGLIGKIHQTHERIWEDHTPEDYNWLPDVNNYCNTNYRWQAYQSS